MARQFYWASNPPSGARDWAEANGIDPKRLPVQYFPYDPETGVAELSVFVLDGDGRKVFDPAGGFLREQQEFEITVAPEEFGLVTLTKSPLETLRAEKQKLIDALKVVNDQIARLE